MSKTSTIRPETFFAAAPLILALLAHGVDARAETRNLLPGTPADWSRRDGCASLFEKGSRIAVGLNLPESQLLGLSGYTSANRSTLIFVKPEPSSLLHQKDPRAVAKPMKVTGGKEGMKPKYLPFPFKSARKGPHVGLVVRPSLESAEPGDGYAVALRLWEKYWPAVEKIGFTVDRDGIVRSPEGQAYFSDYDLIAEFDAEGKRRHFGRDGDHERRVRERLAPLNEAVGGILFRHDGYYEPAYFDELVRNAVPIVLVGPSGEAWVRSSSELRDLFRLIRRTKIGDP